MGADVFIIFNRGWGPKRCFYSEEPNVPKNNLVIGPINVAPSHTKKEM